MKPVYLEFCGINSFSEKAVVDFRALLTGGVFGIFGDTGSGKSTILDCIHLALYGQIERSSGSECINYHLDSAYVVFDFEITTEGERHVYRVRRERRRKNNISKAWLYEYGKEGELMALAEGTRDVNEKLESIIGLAFADFKMCIALPQGEFASLVKASTSERVKLVSRLFDLEKYGERLFKAVSAKYYKAEEAVNLVKAKMEQNEGSGDEVIAQKQQEILAFEERLTAAETALNSAETAFEKANALKKEKTAYEALKQALATEREKLPLMEKKRADTEKLPLAKSVRREALACKDNEKEMLSAQEKKAAAEKNVENTLLSLEQAKHVQAEGNFDERILGVSLDLDKVRGAAADLKAEEEAAKKYKECQEEYKSLAKKCPEEPFEEEKKRLEAELASYAEDESLLDYIKHNFKDFFMGETYAEFRTDLKNLSAKYPQTSEDIAVLLEKYAATNRGESITDIDQMHASFKKIEQKRKELKKQIDDLEKRAREYESNEDKKRNVVDRGRIYKEAWQNAQEKNAQIRSLGSETELQARLKSLQNEKNSVQARVDSLQERAHAFRAEAEKQNALYMKALEQAQFLQNALKNALAESGFSSVEEAEGLLLRIGDENKAKGECKAFFDRYQLLCDKYEETDERKFIGFDESVFEQAKEAKTAALQARDELNRAIASASTELTRLLALKEKYAAFEKELAEKEKERELCDELRTLLKSNRFLEYIASEYLQDVCVGASKTLLSLTGGRYFLKYDKEFKVGDNLDGGSLRAVKTLSGGETFLVSLSLALSLSAEICRKSLRPIEFFFLDEGFGTLDEKLVDTVMDVLGKLSKSFAVGLISHVEELKHRIDNKITVTGANEEHGSRLRVECY